MMMMIKWAKQKFQSLFNTLVQDQISPDFLLSRGREKAKVRNNCFFFISKSDSLLQTESMASQELGWWRAVSVL